MSKIIRQQSKTILNFEHVKLKNVKKNEKKECLEKVLISLYLVYCKPIIGIIGEKK